MAPGIVDGLVTTKNARVLADRAAVLEHDNPIGEGADLHRSADRLGRDAVALRRGNAPPGRFLILLTIKADEAG